jgi:hypothetical protein
MGCISGLIGFLRAVFFLLIVFPISAVFAVVRWFAQMVGYSGWFFMLLVLFAGSTVLAQYQSNITEITDYAFRCVLNPISDNVLLPILNLIRLAFNPSICWWDAANWFLFGYFNNVLVPDAIACGAEAMLVDIGCVLTQLFDTLLVFIATGKFLTGFYDMSQLSAALVTFVDDWITLCCCLCQDICCVVKFIPFLLPLPPPLNFIIAALSPQYLFWQAIESAINLFAAIMQIIWPLLVDLIYLTPPDHRPSFANASFYASQAISRLNMALELAVQRVWNTFIPYPIDFTDTLRWASTFGSIVIDSVEVVLTVFTNVDIIVFNMFTPAPNTYVGPPYTSPIDIWRTTVQTIIIRILNSHAPVTDPAFYFDVHLIGRKTLAEGVCVIITRLICVFTGEEDGSSCFNTSANFSSQPMNGGFLAGYNFCCITNNIIQMLTDFNKGLYEMFLFTTGAQQWFFWIDTQTDTRVLADNIGNLADCIFSLVDAVPVVGYCLKNVFVQLVKFVAYVLEFLLKCNIATGTLIYDLIVLGIPTDVNTSPNFLIAGDKAIARWEEIIQILLGDSPDSLLNCVAYILNFATSIPPITLNADSEFMPCNPSCVPVDYIQPPAIIARDFFKNRISKVTPILVYDEKRPDGSLRNATHPWFHPVFLREKLALGGGKMAPAQLKHMDKYFEAKTRDFYARYNAINKCHEDDLYKDRLRKDNPWRYKMLKSRNQLPDTSKCVDIGAYDNVYPGMGKREQRRIFFSSAENFDIYQSYGKRVEPDSADGIATEWWNAEIAKKKRNESDSTAAEWWRNSETEKQNASDRLIPPPDPITSRPTDAPIAGCPPPGAPPNPCFDLACFPRQGIQFGGTLLLTVAHLLDGLIRGNFPDTAHGEVAWGYFTGAYCDKRCLEKDLVNLIIYGLNGLVCACKLLTLILPSSPQFPQPDFCCALTKASDLIANTVQVIINGIKSLVLDAPEFIYFNNGYFLRDVDELFNETFAIVVCLCQLVRYALPISQLTGGTINGGGAFDICCFGMVGADFAITVLQFVIVTIVNLATLESAGHDYWRTGPTQPTIDDIGFIVQVDAVLDSLFGASGGVCADQGRDQGIGGFNSCVCQLLALVVPIRQHPGLPISETNCPIVDLCCFIREVGFFLRDLNKFNFRGIASFWQSWAPQDNNRCDPGRLPAGVACSSLGNAPYAFLDYLFCKELTPWELANLPLTPFERIDAAKCGKFMPVLQMLVDIISACPCQLGNIVDAWLAQYFPGFDCFCGVDDGLITNSGDLLFAILNSVNNLVRRINDISYWQPFGRPGGSTGSINGQPAGPGPCLFDEHTTWTWEFFGPIIDSLCNTISASTCFLDIFLPFCQEERKRIVKSGIAWGGELIVKIGALIEGIVGIFVNGPTCGSGGDVCPSGTPSYGVTVDGLADVFTSLFSFVIDSLIGDSSVVCSMVNPPMCPSSDLCCCYNTIDMGVLPCDQQAPALTGGPYYLHVVDAGVFSNPAYQCAQCLDPGTCSEYSASYAYPTCAAEGATMKPCFDDGTSGLPSCDVQNPLLTKLDGGLMASLRYLQCSLGQLLPVLAKIIQGLVIIVSVVWQLANSILRLIAAVIMFFFALFASLGGGCDCYGAYHASFGSCYQCQQLYHDGGPAFQSGYQCVVTTGFTLTWATTGFPVGHVFAVGASFPCTQLAYSSVCLAAGGLNGATFDPAPAPNGVTTSFVGAEGTCVEAAYSAWITVTNGDPNVPSNVIFVSDAQVHPNPSATTYNGIPYATVGPNNECVQLPSGQIGLVPCSVLTIISNFLNIFSALSSIFETGPIIPPQPALRKDIPEQRAERLLKMETRAAYRQRVKARSNGVGPMYQNPAGWTAADHISSFMGSIWGYSTEDCDYDIIACACRNIELDPEMCATAKRKKTRDMGDETIPVMNALASTMTGTSPCDVHMQSFANASWGSQWPSDRVYYVDCLEKVIQGGRLSEANAIIPADFFHRHEGPLILWENIRASTTETLNSEQTRVDRARERTRRSIDPIERASTEQQRWTQRKVTARNFAKSHPRWRKSLIANALIEIDQLEYKLRTGYYLRMAKMALANLRDGRLPTITVKEKLGILYKAGRHSAGNMYSMQLREAFSHIYEGVAAIPSALAKFSEKSPWEFYREAVSRHHAKRAGCARSREKDARQAKLLEITRRGITSSPIYKWWYSVDDEGKKQAPPSYSRKALPNPLTRLAKHLTWVVQWHRDNWAENKANMFTADLHLRNNIKWYIDQKFQLRWTPQILSNWESVARLFYRFKVTTKSSPFSFLTRACNRTASGPDRYRPTSRSASRFSLAATSRTGERRCWKKGRQTDSPLDASTRQTLCAKSRPNTQRREGLSWAVTASSWTDSLTSLSFWSRTVPTRR